MDKDSPGLAAWKRKSGAGRQLLALDHHVFFFRREETNLTIACSSGKRPVSSLE
jgi:hypothetical protein